MSEQEQGTGTAVAKRDGLDRSELDRIRREGRLRAERKKELREIYNSIKGVQFGNVKGYQMSEATRYQVARLCFVTGADPSRHVDIMGNAPYLNGEFYAEKINTHQRFVGYNQREISEDTEEELRDAADKKRERAASYLQKAEELGDDSFRERAIRMEREAADLEEEADDLPVARAKWGVPDWATDVVETTIRRFKEAAPLEEIQSGRIDQEPWIHEVRECNWAGGKGEHKAQHHPDNKSFKKDPIGDADPAKSARTRSLRRCAVRAFPAWMEKFEELKREAEKAISADIDLMEAADRPELPGEDGPQALTGSGEPEVRSTEGARSLPEEEASGAESSEAEPAASDSGGTEDDGSDPEEIDRQRKAYFANLRDGPGITDDEARYEWQDTHDLPSSTTDWALEHWQTANRLLVAEARRAYVQACDALDVDAESFAEDALGFSPPMTIGQYRELTERLETVVVDEDGQTVEDQPEMELDQ